MSIQARIDAPGALHRIIARGNEKRKIFAGKPDRQQFLARLGDILSNTETACYAWTIIPEYVNVKNVPYVRPLCLSFEAYRKLKKRAVYAELMGLRKRLSKSGVSAQEVYQKSKG